MQPKLLDRNQEMKSGGLELVPDATEGFGRHLQVRGNVLQWEALYDLWLIVEELTITLFWAFQAQVGVTLFQ